MILSKSFLVAFTGLASSVAAELTVAIYGGGVASATLAQALKGYDHINLQYYDPALNLTPTSFRLLGLSPKAWTALDLIGEEAGGAINRATWYPEDPSIIIVGQGSDAGTVVLDYDKLPNTTHHPEVAVVDPAPFLMEMLNGTDKGRLHPNTTLLEVKNLPKSSRHPLELSFDDGTTLQADVLIGDDGPVGFMRPYVLGAENLASYPVFMNFLSAVGHVPPKDAHKLLGSPYGDIDSQRRFERVGKGSWFLNAYLDQFFTCLGSFYTTENYNLSQFTRPTSKDELQSRFGSFEDGDGIVEVLSRFSGLRLIPEIEHPKAPTYVKGLVAMTGNAAHTMTNFQQLGPGQELEDAMILGTLLREAHDHDDLKAALQAYDETRRPRSQRVAHQGKRLGLLWTGMVDGVGIDPERLRQAFLDWREESESFDLVKHKAEALRIMRKNVKAIGKGIGKGLGLGLVKQWSGLERMSVSGASWWVQQMLGQFQQEPLG
ncbi:hypothetical protein EV356DRAFT_453610 [Viridothelium virens]|uniref:FAD/NAD(P)-binding domain-containing protein n=1 Tax=Viridothelium virens TaxID=1048519 RepID=A0A6A6GXM0_VIRVR|nr:hypothetical protein EV356DRAFT_453610 [Viridothelium virens]